MAKSSGRSKTKPSKPASGASCGSARNRKSTAPAQSEPKYELASVLNARAAEVWSLRQIQDFLAIRVDAILESRSVPRTKIHPPRMDVAVPALEAMRYCPLRDEIAAILAASMDGRSSQAVHPSFIEILRQVTRDELAILMTMPVQGDVIAMGHVHKILARGRTRLLHRNVLPSRFAKICDVPGSIPVYVDNLLRLELIAVPTGLSINEQAPYEALLKNDFCRRCFDERPRAARHRLEKSLLAVTDLGDRFRQACLNTKS